MSFFEEHSGIFHIIEIILSVIIIAFLLITVRSQNSQIIALEEKVNNMEMNTGLNITMDQVNKSIDTKIEESQSLNNETLSETMMSNINATVKESMDTYKEEIYLDIYKQVTSDLNASAQEEENKDKKDEDEQKEEDTQKTDKKSTTKKTSTGAKSTAPSTSSTPPSTPPTPPSSSSGSSSSGSGSSSNSNKKGSSFVSGEGTASFD